MMISLICSFTDGEYELKSRYEIESLDVFNGIRGSFTLGSGTIKNKPIYYFYRKAEEGYILQTLGGESKDGLVILKQDSDKHYVEVYEAKGNFWQLSMKQKKYIIVVPENTIKKEFNANIVGG